MSYTSATIRIRGGIHEEAISRTSWVLSCKHIAATSRHFALQVSESSERFRK